MCLLWVSQTLFPFRLLTQSNQIRIGYLLLSVLDLLAITHAMTEPSAQTVLYGFELTSNLTYLKCITQWQIQDFPDGGANR